MLELLWLTYVRDEASFEYKNPNAPAENVRLEPEINVKFEDAEEGGASGRKDIPPTAMKDKVLVAHGTAGAQYNICRSIDCWRRWGGD